MENMKVSTTSLLLVVRQFFNALFVIVTIILGVVAFFSLLNILLTISASLVIQSANVTVQQKYTISTVRNFYLLFGGCFLLGFLIVSIDYHMRRLSNPKTTRVLIGTFVIEVIIIGLSLII